MKIIIDFDNVLFDTARQASNTRKLITLHGASEKEWDKVRFLMVKEHYYGKTLYTIEEHVRRLGKKQDFDPKKFLRKYYEFHAKESYVFPETLNFLKFARTIATSVHLITYGAKKFQEWKIAISKLAPLFHQVQVVEVLKAHSLAKILSKNELNVFLDDKAQEIDEVKKMFPAVVCIHVRRPNTLHYAQESKYKDFEVRNLTQALLILKRLSGASKMRVVRADKKGIDLAVQYLKAGKVVIYPTDTCYGLGSDASNLAAVKKLYAVKGREAHKPVHVIVADLNMAKKYALADAWTEKLFKKLLPGSMTIVMDLRAGTGPSWKILSARTGTIGIAMSTNKTAQTLAKKLGRPITTTSANFAGEVTAYSVNALLKQYRKRPHQPDLILDAGTLPRNNPTTMVSVRRGKIKIFREGPVTKRQILAALKSKL